MRLALLSLMLVACACGPAPEQAPTLTPEQEQLLAARPYRLVVPSRYGTTPVPLMMLLHGHGSSGEIQDALFRLSELAEGRTFLLATPDGLVDGTGRQYWNATDACCGDNTEKTDDVAYLTAVIDDVRVKYRVDAKRVFLVGHSNGGFMAHRMACDRATRIAGIVSLAGAQWKDPARCQPARAVSALEVHGDTDDTVPYTGEPSYPGAVETVTTWAQLDGCSGTTLASAGADLDLVSTLTGAETSREAFSGCPAGIGVELWTIRGGSHVPMFNTQWGPRLYDWLQAHPKP